MEDGLPVELICFSRCLFGLFAVFVLFANLCRLLEQTQPNVNNCIMPGPHVRKRIRGIFTIRTAIAGLRMPG